MMSIGMKWILERSLLQTLPYSRRTYDEMKDKNEWELNPKATATMKSLLEQETERLPTAGGEVLVYRVSPKFLATTTSRFDVPLPAKDSLGGPMLQIWSLLPEEELVMVPHLIAQIWPSRRFLLHDDAKIVFPSCTGMILSPNIQKNINRVSQQPFSIQ